MNAKLGRQLTEQEALTFCEILKNNNCSKICFSKQGGLSGGWEFTFVYNGEEPLDFHKLLVQYEISVGVYDTRNC